MSMRIMKQEPKASGFAYGTDSVKETAKYAVKTESVSLKKGNSKITVNISKKRQMSQSPHLHKYDIAKYDLHPKYIFPDFLQNLIPTGTPEYIDSGQRYVERMVRALYYFKQCSLIGPSGTGKTHITYLIAELTSLPVWEVNCGLQTSSYDLIGRFIGLGKENWIDGQVTCWRRYGGLLYLDEANMMKQDVATSAEFAGTKPLNAAFRRRMSVWINFDYESVGEKISQKEVELLIKRASINEAIAYKIIRVGAEMRRQYKTGDLPYAPSIGDLIHWGVLIKDGSDPISAAEETIVALTSDSVEVQADVRRLIESIFNS